MVEAYDTVVVFDGQPNNMTSASKYLTDYLCKNQFMQFIVTGDETVNMY